MKKYNSNIYGVCPYLKNSNFYDENTSRTLKNGYENMGNMVPVMPNTMKNGGNVNYNEVPNFDYESNFLNGSNDKTSNDMSGSTLDGSPVAPTMIDNPEFIPGYLRTQIGKKVRIEFLIGTSTITDRIGELVDVGAAYVIIRPEETDDLLMADLYSIKFVTIYQ